MEQAIDPHPSDAKMRSLALVLLLAAVCAAHPGIKQNFFSKIITHLDVCTKKHGTNTGDLLKIVMEKSPVEDHAMKCTLDCYMTEAGYLKDGKVDWEAARQRVKEVFDDAESTKKAMNTVNTCQKQVNVDGKGECEIGAPVLQCLMNNTKWLTLPMKKPSA